MSYCVNGTESFTLTKPEDRTRFNEILDWVKGNIDAAKELFNREKSGEVVSPDTPLFNREDQLVESTIPSEMIADKDLERVKKIVDNQIEALKKRINDLTNSRNRLKPTDRGERDTTIAGLEDLLDELSELETREQFIALVEYAQEDITKKLDWLTKESGGFNPTNTVHLDTFRAITQQLKTYQGINVPRYAANNSTLKSKIEDVNNKYQDLQEAILDRRESVLREMLKLSTNSKFKDEANFEQYLRESQDITGLEQMFLDIDTSKDTLLAIIGKKFAAGRQEVHELVSEFSKKANEAGRKLKAAGIDNFDFMVDKTTARIVQRVSTTYKDTLDKLFAETDSLEVDDKGFKIKQQYVQGTDDELSDEDKAHNLQLGDKKRAISSFLRAEQWNKETKELEDGENKRYTQTFKDARNYYEIYTAGGWEKREEVSDEEYRKYVRRYYGPKVTAYRLVKEDGEYTGAVEEFETRYVKDRFTEVTEKWDSNEYKAIQSNDAMREFYDFYNVAYKELMDKLPADIAAKMDGKVLRVKDEFMDRLLQKKVPLIKRILRELKDLILPDIITSGRVLDEDGRAVNDIGIFYVGDLRSEKRIAELELAISEIIGSSKEDKKKRDKLKKSLLIEEAKLTPETVNYNLVDSLVAGMQMATNYDVMKNMESSFIMAQDYLHNKNIYRGVDSNGDPIVDAAGNAEFKEKGTSNVDKRLQTWMRMVFYNNSQANNSRVAKLGMMLKRYTSFLGVGGLAVFPAINNIVTAEMGNVIEGFGGRFYKNKNYVNSSKMLATSLASGKWVGRIFKTKEQYEDDKPHDLVTALVKHFNFLEDHIDMGDNNIQKEGLRTEKVYNWMYALTEGGEYQAQVRSGLAYLDGKGIIDKFEFNETTKELVLKEGEEFSTADRRRIAGEIRNMNKIIHGNHSSIDRVPMQENWYGELAFQFKRWMPNAIRSRISGSYYDESVGLEMEGRYRAVGEMFSNMSTIADAFNGEAWKKLSPLEQANMRKNAVEIGMFATALALYIIFDAIRDGVPPEDETLRAALNFVKLQADRSMGEIDFFVNPLQWYNQTKSPVAGLRIIGEAGEFLGALVGIPFNLLRGKPEKLRFEKGVNKGDLKAWKEGRDLIPGLKQISNFRQLDVTGDFFIK